MRPFPALRRLWQRPLLRFALLGLLPAGGAAWYVAARGGWANIQNLPPLLDASTPRTQNGFTLLDIQRPGQIQGRFAKVNYPANTDPNVIDTADAFGLWIKPPSFPDNLLSGAVDSETSRFGKALSVTARLSTGETLPLVWHLRDDEWPPPGQASQRLLFVALPSGYSDACRFVDFTIADQSGHAAHWRVTQIPRMRHAIPRPAIFTTTITQDGITMSAQAWHDQPGQINGQVNYLLRPMLPQNSHQWEIVKTDEWQEWEPFAYEGHIPLSEHSGTPILGRNGVFKAILESRYGGGFYNFAGGDPYPEVNHFLRLTCALQQFETYDEPVTFHNVAVQYDADGYRLDHEKNYFLALSKPLTVTTPSGVTVTLPVQGQRFQPLLYANDLNFMVRVQPQIEAETVLHPLPNSPLARTFSKPVQISLTFPLPSHLEGWSYDQSGALASCAMSLPPNPAWHFTPKGLPDVPYHRDLPPVLKDFTVIIRQRVDLRTIPMTFTLPITNYAPPDYPTGYQPPKRL